MATPMEQVQGPLVTNLDKPRRFRVRMTLGEVVALIILLVLSFVWLVPFAWMISTSLKTSQDMAGFRWIPTTLAWENYRTAFSYGMWLDWTKNTFIIAILAVVGAIVSNSLVAYAFARLRWPGRDVLFSIVLATMMLPGIVTMIPQFIVFSRLPAFGIQGSARWVNTFLPLVVPAFTGSAFYIFLLRQFMRGIPMELSEAAKIDGASEFRTMWNIVLPLTAPALAAISIFQFQGAWEDFMGPLLYLQSERLYTLQLGLRQFEHAAGGSVAWNWLMAASLAVMIPVIVVFVLFQRYFIEGVTMTGMGGR